MCAGCKNKSAGGEMPGGGAQVDAGKLIGRRGDQRHVGTQAAADRAQPSEHKHLDRGCIVRCRCGARQAGGRHGRDEVSGELGDPSRHISLLLAFVPLRAVTGRQLSVDSFKQQRQTV